MERNGEGGTTWYEWVARAVALTLCMCIVVGVWLVLYGFKPWPGLERTLATYPVPSGWTSVGRPARTGCSTVRKEVDPGCDPNGPYEDLIVVPRPDASDACTALKESATAWEAVGFVPSAHLRFPAGPALCRVQGAIRGRWVQLSVYRCCNMPGGHPDGLANVADGTAIIQVEISPHPP